jgi:hypothetical protein
MYGPLTPERFALITATMFAAPVDQVEPRISRPKVEAALEDAFGGPGLIELDPNPVEQGARFCAALIRNPPLPEGNKRVAFECMLEVLVSHGYSWPHLSGESIEVAEQLDGLAEGTIGEDEFVFWARAQVGLAEWLRYQRRVRLRIRPGLS